MNRRFLKRSLLWPVIIMMLAAAAMIGLAISRMPANGNALQIRPARTGISLPDGFYVYQSLSQRGIHIKSITPLDDGLVVQLDSAEQLQMAHSALQDILPEGFIIRNCEPSHSRALMEKLNHNRLKLG
ncbi:EnvZ/OmpR regulon moderator MzrA [Rahnella sp. EDr1-12]|uniref:EnvZ/OmpR regulon moderator MzrA n=1 Tax=unclassified Rahnella TaxID=2635087 RepID=UPI003BAC2AA0